MLVNATLLTESELYFYHKNDTTINTKYYPEFSAWQQPDNMTSDKSNHGNVF